MIRAKDFCCILEQFPSNNRYDYPYLDGDIGIIDGKAVPIMPETICPLLDYKDDSGHHIGHMDILEATNRYGKELFLIQWLKEDQMFSAIKLSRPGTRLNGSIETQYYNGSAEINWRDFVYQVLQHPFDDNMDLEVIGNAFSNPSLLNPYLPEERTIDLRWGTTATSSWSVDLERMYTETHSEGSYINVPRFTF